MRGGVNIFQNLPLQVIPQDLHARLISYLLYVGKAIPNWMTESQRAMGITAVSLFNALTENLEKQRPLRAALTVGSLNERMVASAGFDTLDDYLRKEAKGQGKQVHGAEQPKDQCNTFDVDTDTAISELERSLVELELIRMGLLNKSSHEVEVQSYRQGTMEPDLDVEVEKRNKKMAALIIDLLRENPDTYFFAFGVRHFIGKGKYNIPNILRSAGFDVVQVPRSTSDSAAPNPRAAVILMMVGLILCLKL